MDRRTYTDESLSSAVAQSHSWREVLRRLGLTATSASAIRSVRLHVGRLGLDTAHFTGQRRWSDDDLGAAVAAATSWTQVADHLGLAGGSGPTALKGHAARLGIDTSHLGRRRPRASHSLALHPDLAHLGRSGSMLAAAVLSMCGFSISWPLEPCRYDLVATRSGEILRLQVKTTRVRKSGSWVVSLSTTGGPRLTYDPADIDSFFVIDGELDCYLLPVSVVGGMHSASLSLYTDFRLPRLLHRP